MKSTLLFFIFLIIAYSSSYAQNWNGTTGTGTDIYRSGKVEIGTSASPSFSDQLTVEGNVSIISSSPTAYKQINGRSAQGAIGLFAGYGTTDGAGITLSGNDEQFYAGGIRFTAIDATVNYPNDKAFSFALFNSPTWTDLVTIYKNGSVAIGTTTALNNTKFAVGGLIACHELKVIPTGNPWPDYVFSPDHKKMSLNEVAEYINTHKHLPQFPSAAVVEKEGFKIAETQTKMLEALEELYLHVIDLKKENEQLKKEISAIKK